MTRYTVLWDTALQSQFISVWTEADSDTRSVLTDIANWIDTALSVDPHLKGRADTESELVRIVAVPSSATHVSVAYQVLSEDRQVRVIRLVFRM